ncbi:MAG: hypothetical protein ACK568_19615, partial [Pseudanabaena sp.]
KGKEITMSLLEGVLGTPIAEQVDGIRNKLIDVIMPRAGIDIDAGVRAKLEAEIKINLDEKLLTLVKQLEYVVGKSKTALSELLDEAFKGLSNLRSEVEVIVDKFLAAFNPDQLKAKLIDPIFDKLEKLEDKIFKDIDRLIDKIDVIFTGTGEELKNAIQTLIDPALLIPNPFDQCRRLQGLEWTIGTSFTLVQIYRFRECKVLEKLDENTKIQDLVDAYGGLQLNAWKMACVSRGAPGLQKNVMQDWIKYGQLISLWSQFSMSLTPLQAAEEAIKKLEDARLEFLTKSSEIDSINTELKKTKDELVATKQALESQILSSISTLRNDVETGSVVAQRAVMLQARDRNHWLRFHRVDATNHDLFELWRTDGNWFPTIRVQASDKLLARDEGHWMRHKGVDAANQDCYGLLRSDGVWFNLIQVAATGNLP